MATKTSLSSTGTLTLSDIGSVFFPGTSDFLTIPSNSNLAPGTGDFTIEAWVYPTAALSTYNGIYETATTNALYFGKITNGYGVRSTGSADLISTPAPAINQWVHVAATRSGTSLRIFINGELKNTVTDSTNFQTALISIGASSLGANAFTGYISNLRFIKGTALYTSSFFPSTVPLTPVNNTQLLTCQGPVIKDASANNFTVTINNNPSYNNLSPFSPFLKENVIESGSILFDGTNDYLTLPTSSKFAVAANQDFTMEAWVYLTATRADFSFIIYFYDGPSILQFRIGNAGFGFRIQGTFGGSASSDAVFDNASYTQTTILNQWTHLALCRTGDSTTFFVNGAIAQTRTGTGSRNISPSVESYISYPDPYGFPGGNISNVRLVIGTALYTNSFTPQPPLDNIPNTQLLLKSTTNSLWLKDDSINNHSITATGNTAYSSLSPETAINNVSLKQTGLVAKELDEVTLEPGSTAQRQMADGTLMVRQFSEVV
jgi:hypothetical protein